MNIVENRSTKMTITLLKKINGVWYEHGHYTEHNLESLCMAYKEVTSYAEDIKMEVEKEADND